MSTCVYVAGPMTGIPEHNVPAFDRAAEALRKIGYQVISPPDITRAQADHIQGIHSDGTIDPAAYRALVRHDLRALLDVDIIAMLPGWRQSKGARLEYLVAEQLGLPIYTVAGLLAAKMPIGPGHLIVTAVTADDA